MLTVFSPCFDSTPLFLTDESKAPRSLSVSIHHITILSSWVSLPVLLPALMPLWKQNYSVYLLLSKPSPSLYPHFLQLCSLCVQSTDAPKRAGEECTCAGKKRRGREKGNKERQGEVKKNVYRLIWISGLTSVYFHFLSQYPFLVWQMSLQ